MFKRGMKFIHASWLDSNNRPLLCEVTRVAQGIVYWKQPGERKAHSYFLADQAARYVRSVHCDSCGVNTPLDDIGRHGQCGGCESWDRQRAREEEAR